MSIPNIIGGIKDGTSFMIASIKDNKAYLLNGSSYNNGTIYYWESNLQIILKSTKIPIFFAKNYNTSQELPPQKQQLVLTDTINGGGLSFRSDGVTLGNASKGLSVNVEQTKYANWWRPNSLLSAVAYTFYNNSGTVAQVLTEIPDNNGEAQTIRADNLIMLPTLWYYGCTSSGKYSYIPSVLDSVVNWFCLVNGNKESNPCKVYSATGWTTQDDCFDGLLYPYCPKDILCGNEGCKGPCSKISNVCTFNEPANFTCKFNAEQYFSETEWWKSPIFIAGVIALIGGILVLLGAAGFLFYKNRKKKQRIEQEKNYLV